MIPTNLVRIDGYSGFLGTFDNENWWKTQPLPGDIDIVTDAVWIYGQYHICSANMTDGTFSIFQSQDNGYSWSQVLNTAERINGIFKPDYGIALAATSSGWWRSTNSGTTWTKVTTTAPNCFCCKSLTNNILIALSQNDVWRSTDGGLTWNLSKTTIQNIIYSAIDGTYYDCLLGIGKTMWYSNDGGLTWNDITNRMTGWLNSSDYIAITDIELTSIMGSYLTYTNLPTWVIQVELSTGFLRHFYSIRTPGAGLKMINHVSKFLAKKSINNSLISTETLHTGTSDIDRVTIFVGTNKYNLPMIKISEDAGINWTEIDTSESVIYTGPDMTQLSSGSNMFTDDIYFSASWIHSDYCHNYFTTYDTYYERNQSFDIDLFIKLPIPYDKICLSALYIANHHIKTYEIDVLNKNFNNKTYLSNIVNFKTEDKGFIAGLFSKKPFIKEHDIILAIANRLPKTYQVDQLLQKPILIEYYPRCYITDNEQKTYSMSINLIDDHVDQVMNLIERYTPQPPDIRYPSIPYNVWDSRKEGVTL